MRSIACGGSLSELRVGTAGGAGHPSVCFFERLPHEQSIERWAAELRHWLSACSSPAALHSSATAPPAISALCSYLAQPQAASLAASIKFVTRLGSRSCDEATLRKALQELDSRHAGHCIELVCLRSCEDGPRSSSQHAPSSLILLQGEFIGFSASVLTNSSQVSAWVASYLAQQHGVHVSLDLSLPSASAGERRNDIDTVLCWGTPALLHEEVAMDVPACICHGAPLDGRGLHPHRTFHTSGRSARSNGSWGDSEASCAALRPLQPRCSMTGLELDGRDLRHIGCVGSYLWNGSLSAAATATCSAHRSADGSNGGHQGGEIESGVVVDECDQGGRPIIGLRMLSRIRLSDLPLTILYGHPWLIRVADHGEDASLPVTEALMTASATDKDMHAAVLRGLSLQLHAQGEGLLCGCVRRERVGSSTGHPPASLHTLLAENLMLLPTGPPHDALILKALGTPSQIVPLPLAPILTDHTAEAQQLMKTGVEQASRLLDNLSLDDSFNPLFQCSGGTAALLARCCAALLTRANTAPRVAHHTAEPAQSRYYSMHAAYRPPPTTGLTATCTSGWAEAPMADGARPSSTQPCQRKQSKSTILAAQPDSSPMSCNGQPITMQVPRLAHPAACQQHTLRTRASPAPPPCGTSMLKLRPDPATTCGTSFDPTSAGYSSRGTHPTDHSISKLSQTLHWPQLQQQQQEQQQLQQQQQQQRGAPAGSKRKMQRIQTVGGGPGV